MAAYARDLRQHILRACAQHRGSSRTLAQMVGGSRAFVEKVLCQHRATGDLAPKLQAGGRTARRDRVGHASLAPLGGDHPEATLADLWTDAATATGVRGIGAVPQHDGAHGTMRALLGSQGVAAVRTSAGATAAEVVRVSVEPVRRPPHGLREPIAQTGARLLYVPPASPARSRFDTVELGRHLRYYATSAWRTCPLKAQGTRTKGGRRSTRWVYEPWLEQMEPRVHACPEIMTQRKELVAHPFGTMKRGWDQGDVQRRGLAKVRAAFSLPVLAYHLRRVLNLVDRPRLLASLGSGGRGAPVGTADRLLMRDKNVIAAT